MTERQGQQQARLGHAQRCTMRGQATRCVGRQELARVGTCLIGAFVTGRGGGQRSAPHHTTPHLSLASLQP